MGQGTVMIQAREANEAFPLANARVQIMDQAGQVLYDLRTDESGQTPVVSLPTVDKKYTMDPDYPGSPYTSYQVEISKDGFNNLHIADLQILDGEEAIQPADLLPMMANQSTPVEQERVFGKHAVELGVAFDEANAPAQQEETAPLRITPRMLPLVVVPNPITVHLGAPSSYARNVEVSFPDYVKNVASSEIYASWPEEALRANIYAIITFALNRVYTEWYRSQGYDFDITNNTAYDQYFVYGRTTYDSINKIVDEIFNQYVRRQGQLAPYFTSYCDGRQSTCNGLSQWGTVALAEQGKSALEILRTYYPKDVGIAETNVISGFLESYPGTSLRVGSTGREVETLQAYLMDIRGHYPAIPLITDAAGVFGSSTEAAVKKFQSLFDLTSDGVVGKATWNKMVYIYIAVRKLNDLSSEGSSLGVGRVPPSETLRPGSMGVNVQVLQYLLDVIRSFYPTIPTLIADGHFGSSTSQAIMAFQRMEGLSADGIVGPATWRALYNTYWGIMDNALNPSAPSVPSTPSQPPNSVKHTVKAGDTLWKLAQTYGTTVAAIKALNNLTSDSLTIGQSLWMPSGSSGGTTTPPPSQSVQYSVKSGDTLWKLAQAYHTTVAVIKSMNDLTSDALFIGQVLWLPSGSSGGTSTPPANTVRHTVVSGDTLWKLAQRYGTTVAAIKARNNLTSDALYIGQVLVMP